VWRGRGLDRGQRRPLVSARENNHRTLVSYKESTYTGDDHRPVIHPRAPAYAPPSSYIQPRARTRPATARRCSGPMWRFATITVTVTTGVGAPADATGSSWSARRDESGS
jgi:hypothetical protein